MTEPETMGEPKISTWGGEARSQSSSGEPEEDSAPLHLSHPSLTGYVRLGDGPASLGRTAGSQDSDESCFALLYRPLNFPKAEPVGQSAWILELDRTPFSSDQLNSLGKVSISWPLLFYPLNGDSSISS